MFAIRDERDYVVQEDFMKAVRKLNDAKKLESSLTYDSSFGVCRGEGVCLWGTCPAYQCFPSTHRTVAKSNSSPLRAFSPS